jgi:L-gulonolactone oxidase
MDPMVWTNWAGTVTARPVATTTPGSSEEIAAAVRDAGERGLRLRMRGSGHSFTDVAATDGVMLDPALLRGVVAVDRSAMTVSVLAGTPLHELNAQLDTLGLALHNMGDIDRQTVAGALSTGTHGTGGTTASLAGQVEALELVTGDGSLRAMSGTEDPDHFAAALVGLGAVGVLTTVTFRVEPAFTLQAEELPMRWAEAVGRHDELVAKHHHVDLYWYPHTDRCTVKLNDRTIDEPEPLSRVRAYVDDELLSNTVFGAVDRLCSAVPAVTRQVNRITSRALAARSYRDASHRVFVAPRRVVFREMEYSVPRAVGMTALQEVRRLIDSSRWDLAWPVEVRATPPDDAWLSPTHGRESLYLAFHVGRGTDHREYFGAVEELLRDFEGRPHWGKLHRRTAADLAPAYPHWEDFARVRDRVDPDRVFGNDYLDRVLG